MSTFSTSTTEKLCRDCDQLRPVGDFHKHKSSPDGRQTYCKVCQAVRTMVWRKNNPREWRAHILKSKKYGLTLDQYEELLELQDHRCAICRRTSGEADGSLWLAVDHDHTTGQVRGLLCRPCNGMLGMANDDIDKLVRAAEYLRDRVEASL